MPLLFFRCQAALVAVGDNLVVDGFESSAALLEVRVLVQGGLKTYCCCRLSQRDLSHIDGANHLAPQNTLYVRVNSRLTYVEDRNVPAY